jgi:hypothetical protein
MKRLQIILILLLLASGASSAWAKEQTILARITVYWPLGGEAQTASSNGAKLHGGHCAVDPHKIPYGSQVVFPDATCIAVDSGPAVTSRLAARKCGKTVEQRAALVIDRFFETKKAAMAWAAANPHFMQVKVLDPHQKLADRSANAGGETGPESAQKKSTKPYTPNASVSPPNVLGSLIPMIFGWASPRS